MIQVWFDGRINKNHERFFLTTLKGKRGQKNISEENCCYYLSEQKKNGLIILTVDLFFAILMIANIIIEKNKNNGSVHCSF